MDKILEFIKVFQSESNLKLFKEVSCYWFSVILHERFTNSEIYYNPDEVHFATKIQGSLYDISGKMEDEGYYNFHEYIKIAPQEDIDSIYMNCILIKGGE